MELTDFATIRELLARHGFHFSKSLGQNFLTAAWVPERIADEAGLDKSTGVLEIGPGIGSLTQALSRHAGRVVALELDRRLEPILNESLAGLDNIEILFSDLLKTDLPALVRDRFSGLRPVVCANLPYNITSPAISALIEAGCFADLTVMVQREVARRICAKPGKPEYGAFGVYVNWHTEPQILFDVPPNCFMPRPKVTSSVLRLTPRSAPPAQVSDEKLFFRIVRASFNQRRKTLENALASGLPEFSKPVLHETIVALGLGEKIRGEALAIAQFALLANALAEL
ncbi:MAG: 16S rRNA (adenine(1518)-N(6)/adenine(1519)-N(6))-dimethyltransferase RsmA [Oscillospiraceae bacterium]|nr:16S rRNA (adenine(1518)-N(6)/adenine(1519)-N(6))-dimethyltransferase RsmA [Oscillospiraceae bacterium]